MQFEAPAWTVVTVWAKENCLSQGMKNTMIWSPAGISCQANPHLKERMGSFDSGFQWNCDYLISIPVVKMLARWLNKLNYNFWTFILIFMPLFVNPVEAAVLFQWHNRYLHLRCSINPHVIKKALLCYHNIAILLFSLFWKNNIQYVLILP